MKKIFITIVMALFAMTTFAQQSQQYFRVEFTVPITGDKIPAGQSNTSVAATMKDKYTYCNPEHDYLDFQAGGNLVARGSGNGESGKASPMGFRSTTSYVSENSSFYLDNQRTAQYNTSTNQAAIETYPYMVDKIKKISVYSIPVERVYMIDSVPFTNYVYPGYPGKKGGYRGTVFTFNRLPRNVAELKTLMENSDGSRVEATKNPLFVAAVMYLVCPRLLDCSQDCRDMIDFLCGTQYKQLNTYGMSNAVFQDLCTGMFGNVDYAGYQQHNCLFQHFAGAKPGNQYKPNGIGYGYDNGPYKVRVAWDDTPTEYSGQMRVDVARILLMANPDATTKDELAFDDPTAHLVKVRATNSNGWFMLDGLKNYFVRQKDQFDDSF